jgi:hypothetical protein
VEERDYDRIEFIAKIAVWIVVVPLFALVCWYWIDRFATYGIVGSLFTIAVTIATYARYRSRR